MSYKFGPPPMALRGKYVRFEFKADDDQLYNGRSFQI
jgi:hypothetical protein